MILLNSFMGLFWGFKALYIGYGNTAAQYTYLALMRMLISPLSIFPLLLCHTVYQSRCDDFSGSKQCCFVMALGDRPKEAAFLYSVIVTASLEAPGRKSSTEEGLCTKREAQQSSGDGLEGIALFSCTLATSRCYPGIA
jgi:hypothetical protein